MNLNFLAMSCRNYLTQGHIISFLCYIDPSKPNIFYKFVLTKNRFFANSDEEKLFCTFWECFHLFFTALQILYSNNLMCIPQLFSLMLHKNASDKFSFESCKFTIQRSKESTGRFVYVEDEEDNGDDVDVNLNLTKDCCYNYLESF